MSKRKLTKKEILKIVKDTLLIILGNFVLAFGTAIFLTKLNIVAGGLSGIGIIFQYHFGQYVGGQLIDIVVFIFTWILWVIGLIFLGKDFALKTLISAIVYPLALSLFLRVPVFGTLSESICYYGLTVTDGVVEGSVPIGHLLLCGLFGGVFVGTGVALTFTGGGSTGGVDVIIALLGKYTPIKESVASFMIDAVIIVTAMIAIPNNIVPALA